MKIGDIVYHPEYGLLKVTKSQYKRLGNRKALFGIDESGQEHELDDNVESPEKYLKERAKEEEKILKEEEKAFKAAEKQARTEEVAITRKEKDEEGNTTYYGEKDGEEIELDGKEGRFLAKKLDEVKEAIQSIPKVEIPEPNEFPAFPAIPEYPKFPAFPEKMTVNLPDLSKIEAGLEKILSKDDEETRSLIKQSLEELKKVKSDAGVVIAIKKLAEAIPKTNDYTEILQKIQEKLSPVASDLKINNEQWKQLTKALSSMGGPGGGPGAVQLRTESGAIINPATSEKQDAIVTAIENITIPAPAGGATEAKQDTIITALGDITTPSDTQPVSVSSLPLPIGAATSLNQDTLNSLIETLQELVQRLAPLAAAMNSGAPAIRTTPIASVSTAVTGTVTATVASTVVSSLTNFGTGIPASEMAHDMNNQVAILANINNVTP